MPEEIENKTNTENTSAPAAASHKSNNFFEKNKTPILIIALVILTAFLVMLALSPNKKSTVTPPSSTPKAMVNPADTTIAMTPATASAATTKSVDININTGKNHLNAVQLEISFDPSVVTNVSIVKGTFLQDGIEIYKKIDVPNGRISYTLAAPIGSKGYSGSGVGAVITYTQVSTTTPAKFNFLPKTAVTDPSFSETALKSSADFSSQ